MRMQRRFAFLDIHPVNAGQWLVVPREHYEVLQDIPGHVGSTSTRSRRSSCRWCRRRRVRAT